jgi:aquaglyceroporin related protein
MVMFGDGSVAQVLLSTGQTTAPGGNGFGSYQSISWGWGLGVMLGIYVAGDSGAYLNPAITFSNCLYRQLPWRRFPVYLLAQFLGGFVGSGIVYANYISAINWFEGGPGIRTVPPAPKATAAIFCTYPQPFVTKASQFFSEFIASALLMFVIFALKDPSNNGVGKVSTPISSLAASNTHMLLERQMVPIVFVLPHLWARRVFRLGDRIRD